MYKGTNVLLEDAVLAGLGRVHVALEPIRDVVIDRGDVIGPLDPLDRSIEECLAVDGCALERNELAGHAQATVDLDVDDPIGAVHREDAVHERLGPLDRVVDLLPLIQHPPCVSEELIDVLAHQWNRERVECLDLHECPAEVLRDRRHLGVHALDDREPLPEQSNLVVVLLDPVVVLLHQTGEPVDLLALGLAGHHQPVELAVDRRHDVGVDVRDVGLELRVLLLQLADTVALEVHLRLRLRDLRLHRGELRHEGLDGGRRSAATARTCERRGRAENHEQRDHDRRKLLSKHICLLLGWAGMPPDGTALRGPILDNTTNEMLHYGDELISTDVAMDVGSGAAVDVDADAATAPPTPSPAR